MLSKNVNVIGCERGRIGRNISPKLFIKVSQIYPLNNFKKRIGSKVLVNRLCM